MSSYLLRYFVLLIIGLGPSVVCGADVVLREQATFSGPIVRLGDIADISSASPSILRELVSTPLLPAPVSGSSLFLQRSQVRDLLVSRGIDVQNLRIFGEAVVEISKAAVRSEASKGMASPVRTEKEIESSLLKSIERYLIDQTGHDQWRIALRKGDTNDLDSAPLGIDFIVEGGRAPWTGAQKFRVRGANLDEALDRVIVVQATVVKIQSILFSRRSLKKGDIIRVGDVEIRQHEDRAPNNALTTLDKAVGMEAGRSIPANSILQENQVKAPLQVQRGETVTVFARAGGITVKTFVVARQNGAMGDLVQVEALNGKEQFTARVSGRRRLEVLAAGIQAGDYATFERRTQRR